VRVTASGGANVYACVRAGLCALSGWKHGAVCDRVEAFAALCSRSRDLKGVLRERARLGDWVPGFGQPLYPAGDPRGTFLLAAARRLSAGRKRARAQTIFAIEEAMRGLGHRDPTLDLGLCAASAALGLPLGAASAVFAVGRGAGFIAHLLEQRERPELLRPRARYTGPPG
jgi:citrate synthase